MFQKISSFFSLFSPIINILPNSFANSIYLRLVKLTIWYKLKWLKHYIKILLKTKKYYQTLLLINTNTWCPDDLSKDFVDYIEHHYNELVHV